jgi:hypothetical protein
MNKDERQALISIIKAFVPHNGLWDVQEWDKDIRIAQRYPKPANFNPYSDEKPPARHHWFITSTEDWEMQKPYIAQYFETMMTREGK